MPADLAALDALHEAVAAHRKAQAALMDLARRGTRADEWERTREVVDDAAARVFAALDAIDLPSLKRRLEIADAAEAWDDAEDRYEAVRNAYIFDREGTWEGQRPPLMEAIAARARLRALRDAPDAA